MAHLENIKALAAFYADSGINVLTQDAANDYFAESQTAVSETASSASVTSTLKQEQKQQTQKSPSAPQASPEAYKQAVHLATQAKTLEDLAQAIENFEGLSVKRTATQMVFADGDPNADIMVIGEAPGGDEDRIGKPFVGKAGQLLDKMFAAIDMARSPADNQTPIYISNILNWRPPGNRTPTQQEVDISIPFIEKHIALIQPKIIVMMGGVSAKGLLNTSEGITRLRGKWKDFTPQTEELAPDFATLSVKAIATFHPAFLLRQPEKKRESWQDLLTIKNFYAQNQ